MGTNNVKSSDDLVLLGIVCSAHGVRGHVKIKTYTNNPADISAYGPLFDCVELRKFEVSVVSVQKDDFVIAKIAGVSNRSSAEQLKNLRLGVCASCLPKLKKDEFYVSDLVGLSAKLQDGTVLGLVTDVSNFGSCDIVEISTTEGKKLMFPFTESIFPELNLHKEELIIIPPEVIGA